jgi:integrase/recombinase XerD
MDNYKASVTLLHDTRRSKKGEKYPVKLNVYFDGEKKRYKTGIDLTEEEWNKISKNNLRDNDLKITKRKLNISIKKAEDIIKSLEVFSFIEFESLFFEEKRVRRSALLKDLFDEYVKQLEANNQVGTAVSYRTTINSIQKFKAGLKITDVTTQFLQEYERNLLSNNISPSTVGIYMRQLRRIVNVAISGGLLSQQKYPFKGYCIPASRNIKKALTGEQVQALLSYQTNDINVRKALDFWLFSYLSNGMNMTDICLIRPENMQKDFFSFFRAKTKNTKKKDLRPIKVPLTERSRQIIEHWRNRDKANPYLFPVLEEGLSAYQIKYRIQDFIAFVNKHMKAVAKDLGIEVKVGTYVARHTHSTILKRKGVPTELIKENLGHSSVLTTESYLDDFTDDVKMEYAKLLTDFPNNKSVA